MDDTLVTEVET